MRFWSQTPALGRVWEGPGRSLQRRPGWVVSPNIFKYIASLRIVFWNRSNWVLDPLPKTTRSKSILTAVRRLFSRANCPRWILEFPEPQKGFPRNPFHTFEKVEFFQSGENQIYFDFRRFEKVRLFQKCEKDFAESPFEVPGNSRIPKGEPYRFRTWRRPPKFPRASFTPDLCKNKSWKTIFAAGLKNELKLIF